MFDPHSTWKNAKLLELFTYQSLGITPKSIIQFENLVLFMLFKNTKSSTLLWQKLQTPLNKCFSSFFVTHTVEKLPGNL